MTLFALAADAAGRAVFRQVLDRYFGGEPDAATVARLLRSHPRCEPRSQPGPCSR
jgi:uncharacterized protein (DUF1810 family)